MAKTMRLTQALLVELFAVADNGDLVRRVDSNNQAKAGSVAGAVHHSGYRYIKISGESYSAHRLAWLRHYGVEPSGSIDHINQNKLDNSIGNLRIATRSENQRNRSLNKDNASGFTGVSEVTATGKWLARITVEGKLIRLGQYSKKSDAVKARVDAEKEYNFHANHGKNKGV